MYSSDEVKRAVRNASVKVKFDPGMGLLEFICTECGRQLDGTFPGSPQAKKTIEAGDMVLHVGCREDCEDTDYRFEGWRDGRHLRWWENLNGVDDAEG